MSNTNNIPQGKIQLLGDLLITFAIAIKEDYPNTPVEEYREIFDLFRGDNEIQQAIQSLFSPAAQPTGDKPDDVIRKEGDTLLTELKKDKNHITKQLNHKNIISYNTGFHTGYMLGYKAKPQPANEPVEPTEDERIIKRYNKSVELSAEKTRQELEQSKTEDWEKDFAYVCDSHGIGYLTLILKNWIKSNVPKVVVGDWQDEKPVFDRECFFASAVYYERTKEWDYKLWEISKGYDVQNDSWYWMLCDATDGNEWGELVDLKADKYLILPSVNIQQNVQVSDTTCGAKSNDAG